MCRILFLICSLAFGCCTAEELYYSCTHLYGTCQKAQKSSFAYVSKVRDVFILPVKNPSNPLFELENPSNLSVKSKIKLKSDGKNLTGTIVGIDGFYYQTDIPFRRGDSGKAVYDMRWNVIGLVSHQIEKNNRKHYFIVRTDNLKKDEFEKISRNELLADWRVFNDVKEYEKLLFDGVKKCANEREAKKFLLRNQVLRKQYIGWKSAYLKKETEKSFINIRKLYERFCHEKSNDQR